MHRQAMLRATYYPAGDAYARGYYPAGGFFGSIGKALKKAAAPVLKSVGTTALNSLFPGMGNLTANFLSGAGKSVPGLAPTIYNNSPLTIGGAASPAGKLAKKMGGAVQGGPGITAPAGLFGSGPGLLGTGKKKHRRMNPFNWRALRRADRRMHSFAKHVRHYVTVARQGHYGVKPKHRRRSR